MYEGKKWYVYLLCDPDTELPFYVGKGTGNRIERHGTTPENRAKKEVIKQIQAQGKQVLGKKVAEFSNERDALIYEWALINLHHQHLTNIKDNGHYTLAKVKPKPVPVQEPPTLPRDIILPLKEVAKQLGVSKQTVMKYHKEGKLRGAFKIGDRWRFMQSDLHRFLEAERPAIKKEQS